MNASRICISAAVIGIFIGILPAAHASFEGMAAADQVSQDNYYTLMDQWLFTHIGDSRGAPSGADHDAARDNILALFQSYGLSASLEHFSYSGYSGDNVVAIKLGTVHPDQIYILGSHYDDVNNPGADDNASGSALVLEAARILSQYPSEYTIRFITFDHEEQGFIGSSAYVAAHTGDNVLGMIACDMVAYDPDTDNCNVYGRTTSASIKSSVAAAVAEYGDGLQYTIGGDEPYSDHAPFEAAGDMACLFIEGEVWSNPYYHTQQDSFEQPGNLNFPYAIRMTRSVVGWLTDHAVVHLAPLFIGLPDGVPWRVDPNTTIAITVQIRDAGESYVPGSGTLYCRTDGGAYLSTPLTPLGGELYQAVLPPAVCGRIIEFYFSALGDGGTTVYYPADAPATSFSVPAVNLTVYLDDNFEADYGWTVWNDPSLTTGAWQRAVPLASGGPGTPPTDFDGSGKCFVTDNRVNQDVDGGPTILLSPRFDFSTATDPVVRYAYWMFCDDQWAPAQDFLNVQLSGDDGATWVTAEHVSALGGWVHHELHVRDFVPLTSQVQLRFSVADSPNNSVTEAAVDSVYVYDLWCFPLVPCDLNCDGVLNAFDIDPFILALVDPMGYAVEFPACDRMRADVNGDGSVDVFDIDPFVYCILEGGGEQ